MIRFILITILVLCQLTLFAREFRPNQLPNGTKFRCANCHINPQGGGARNAFGSEVELNFLDNKGNVLWGPELAKKDSDGDGFTNGQELQDPEGTWRVGNQNPGSSDLVSIPGNASSVPPMGNVYDGDNLPDNLDISNINISPNPASSKFSIDYKVQKAGYVEMEIYSPEGVKISSLERSYKTAGSHTLNVNLSSISKNHIGSGSYICFFKLNAVAIFKKILIIR